MIRAIVEVTTPEGEAEAFLTRPDDHSHPGVLLIMDVFGLRPTIEEMADRIAAGGYVVLEPNVFYRAGRSPVLPVPDLADPGTAHELLAGCPAVDRPADPRAA